MSIDTTHLTPTKQVTSPSAPTITNSANCTRENYTVIVLDSGHRVSREFYDLIQQQAGKVIPKLRRIRAYQSKELCGKAFWATLTAEQQRMAGRCVVEMVTWGQLPLVPTEGKPNDPLWFRHK